MKALVILLLAASSVVASVRVRVGMPNNDPPLIEFTLECDRCFFTVPLEFAFSEKLEIAFSREVHSMELIRGGEFRRVFPKYVTAYGDMYASRPSWWCYRVKDMSRWETVRLDFV